MPSITLTNGTISVVLDKLDPTSVVPERSRNFTQSRLADDTIAVDVFGTPKRRWVLRLDVPLGTTDKANLDTLYYSNQAISLIENWLESSVTYSVFFENKREFIDAYKGALKYELTIQQLE